MRRSQLLSIPLVAGLLVVGACGDDDHDDGSVPQTGNRPTETTVATSTTVPSETTLPVSPDDSTPDALPDADADGGSTTTTPGGDSSTTTTAAPGTETTTTTATP